MSILTRELRGVTNNEVLHCLAMIQHSADQMSRLIDDLLAFSRLGRQPLQKDRINQEALSVKRSRRLPKSKKAGKSMS